MDEKLESAYLNIDRVFDAILSVDYKPEKRHSPYHISLGSDGTQCGDKNFHLCGIDRMGHSQKQENYFLFRATTGQETKDLIEATSKLYADWLDDKIKNGHKMFGRIDINCTGTYECDLKEKANILGNSNTEMDFCPYCLVTQHTEGYVGPICVICKPLFPESKWCFCRCPLDFHIQPTITWKVPTFPDVSNPNAVRVFELNKFIADHNLPIVQGKKENKIDAVKNFMMENICVLRCPNPDDPTFIINASERMLNYGLTYRDPNLVLDVLNEEEKKQKLIFMLEMEELQLFCNRPRNSQLDPSMFPPCVMHGDQRTTNSLYKKIVQVGTFDRKDISTIKDKTSLVTEIENVVKTKIFTKKNSSIQVTHKIEIKQEIVEPTTLNSDKCKTLRSGLPKILERLYSTETEKGSITYKVNDTTEVAGSFVELSEYVTLYDQYMTFIRKTDDNPRDEILSFERIRRKLLLLHKKIFGFTQKINGVYFHMLTSGHYRDWMLLEEDGNIAKYSTQSKEKANETAKLNYQMKSNKAQHPSEILCNFFGLKLLYLLQENQIINIDTLLKLFKTNTPAAIDLYNEIFKDLN